MRRHAFTVIPPYIEETTMSSRSFASRHIFVDHTCLSVCRYFVRARRQPSNVRARREIRKVLRILRTTSSRCAVCRSVYLYTLYGSSTLSFLVHSTGCPQNRQDSIRQLQKNLPADDMYICWYTYMFFSRGVQKCACTTAKLRAEVVRSA